MPATLSSEEMTTGLSGPIPVITGSPLVALVVLKLVKSELTEVGMSVILLTLQTPATS